MDPPITNNTTGPLEVDGELRRGPWTLEEDTLLTHYIARHGEGRWNMLAKCAGLKRTGKSCRLRWLNYLKPDIKRGNLTPQEQLLILELHSKWGNRWSKIAQHLPGRTDNEIKNYWRTRVQKQARQLNIESNSNRFLDAVRCYWMPRLLQKVEQQTSSSSSSSYSSSRSGSQSSVPCQSADFSTLVPSLSTFPQLANKTADNSNQSPFESSLTNNTIQSMYPTYFMEQTEMVPQNLTSPNAYAQTYFNNNNSNQSYNNIESSTGYNNDMDMEGFSLASTSAVGSYDGTGEEGNWMMCDEMTDNLWNMDDIWQFRDQMGN